MLGLIWYYPLESNQHGLGMKIGETLYTTCHLLRVLMKEDGIILLPVYPKHICSSFIGTYLSIRLSNPSL